MTYINALWECANNTSSRTYPKFCNVFNDKSEMTKEKHKDLTKLHSIILCASGKIMKYYEQFYKDSTVSFIHIWCCRQPLNEKKDFLFNQSKILKKNCNKKKRHFLYKRYSWILNNEWQTEEFFFVFRAENYFLHISNTFRKIAPKIEFDCPTDKIARASDTNAHFFIRNLLKLFG